MFYKINCIFPDFQECYLVISVIRNVIRTFRSDGVCCLLWMKFICFALSIHFSFSTKLRVIFILIPNQIIIREYFFKWIHKCAIIHRGSNMPIWNIIAKLKQYDVRSFSFLTRWSSFFKFKFNLKKMKKMKKSQYLRHYIEIMSHKGFDRARKEEKTNVSFCVVRKFN